jgi:hypothetical protein
MSFSFTIQLEMIEIRACAADFAQLVWHGERSEPEIRPIRFIRGNPIGVTTETPQTTGIRRSRISKRTSLSPAPDPVIGATSSEILRAYPVTQILVALSLKEDAAGFLYHPQPGFQLKLTKARPTTIPIAGSSCRN